MPGNGSASFECLSDTKEIEIDCTVQLTASDGTKNFDEKFDFSPGTTPCALATYFQTLLLQQGFTVQRPTAGSLRIENITNIDGGSSGGRQV